MRGMSSSKVLPPLRGQTGNLFQYFLTEVFQRKVVSLLLRRMSASEAESARRPRKQ
jgi:hypothetical protein